MFTDANLKLTSDLYTLVCGWGDNDKGHADRFSCVNFWSLDQECTKTDVDNKNNWCFYPSVKENYTG